MTEIKTDFNKRIKKTNWCFTDWKLLDIEKICEKNKAKIKYCCWGLEISPTTKKEHHQGWIKFKNQQRLSAILKIFGVPNMWLRPCEGSEAQNEKYCQKDNEYQTWGTFTSQGKRTEINLIYKEILENKMTELEISRKYPREHAKYHKAIQRKIALEKTATQKNNEKLRIKDMILWEWQQQALDKLLEQNNRQVLWIYDEPGNKGKTQLGLYIKTIHNAFFVRNGKSADIAFAYNYEKLVVVDLTREQSDRVNYQIIENFKDGIMFSPKYESMTKSFEPCKVIVLSNFMPDESKLSEDRWDIWDLEDVKPEPSEMA